MINIIFTFKNGWGIGDNVRGLISILQIQKKIEENTDKEVKIYVDFSDSLINKYLKYKLPDEIIALKETIEFKLFLYNNEYNHENDIINFILNSDTNKFYLNTNNYPDVNNITEDIKLFIKNVLEFDPSFEEIFNSYLNQLPAIFDVYHYRLGDSAFNNDCESSVIPHVESFKELKKSNSSLVLSDSLCFKKQIFHLYNNENIIVFLNKPSHTNSTNENDEMYIFIDFFLGARAKNIYCYCCYGRLSNFILWHSYLYDIPLIKISL